MYRTIGGMSVSTLELMTPEQAAKELGVSADRVRQFCKEGRIGQKVGGRWVIPADEVKMFQKIPRGTGRPRGNGQRN